MIQALGAWYEICYVYQCHGVAHFVAYPAIAKLDMSDFTSKWHACTDSDSMRRGKRQYMTYGDIKK